MRCILTADWHLRGDAPICRVEPDNWLEEQKQSVEQLYDIVKDYHCDELWVLGDLFHRARTSTEATVQALNLLRGFGTTPVKVLVGNHDMLAHSYSNVDKSTIGTIFALDNVTELRSSSWIDIVDGQKCRTVLSAYPFGTEPEEIPDCDIWVLHDLVFPDNDARPIPDIGVIAEDLLKRTNARIVATGDYHHGYIREFKNAKVVTCGCLNIQASDMADYKPRVYILDTSDFSIKEVPLKKFGKVHPDPKRESRQSLETYMEGLQAFEVPHLDFIANVEEAMSKENDKDVRAETQKVLDAYNPEKN